MRTKVVKTLKVDTKRGHIKRVMKAQSQNEEI